MRLDKLDILLWSAILWFKFKYRPDTRIDVWLKAREYAVKTRTVLEDYYVNRILIA